MTAPFQYPPAPHRGRAQHERARGNSEWLQNHWPDVLPQARGKFLAVAGHEAFVAPTAKEAWAQRMITPRAWNLLHFRVCP